MFKKNVCGITFFEHCNIINVPLINKSIKLFWMVVYTISLLFLLHFNFTS